MPSRCQKKEKGQGDGGREVGVRGCKWKIQWYKDYLCWYRRISFKTLLICSPSSNLNRKQFRKLRLLLKTKYRSYDLSSFFSCRQKHYLGRLRMCIRLTDRRHLISDPSAVGSKGGAAFSVQVPWNLFSPTLINQMYKFAGTSQFLELRQHKTTCLSWVLSCF